MPCCDLGVAIAPGFFSTSFGLSDLNRRVYTVRWLSTGDKHWDGSFFMGLICEVAFDPDLRIMYVYGGHTGALESERVFHGMFRCSVETLNGSNL